MQKNERAEKNSTEESEKGKTEEQRKSVWKSERCPIILGFLLTLFIAATLVAVIILSYARPEQPPFEGVNIVPVEYTENECYKVNYTIVSNLNGKFSFYKRVDSQDKLYDIILCPRSLEKSDKVPWCFTEAF